MERAIQVLVFQSKEYGSRLDVVTMDCSWDRFVIYWIWSLNTVKHHRKTTFWNYRLLVCMKNPVLICWRNRVKMMLAVGNRLNSKEAIQVDLLQLIVSWKWLLLFNPSPFYHEDFVTFKFTILQGRRIRRIFISFTPFDWSCVRS